METTSETKGKTLTIPATTFAPEATVVLAEDGTVTLDGTEIGRVFKGEYDYSPKAAGHSGRVVRYHSSQDEWAAILPASTSAHLAEINVSNRADFRGGDWKKSRRKNSRLAACAFLVAVANGTSRDRAEYFFWQRNA